MNWFVATGYKQTANGTNSFSIYKLSLLDVPFDGGETGVGIPKQDYNWQKIITDH